MEIPRSRSHDNKMQTHIVVVRAAILGTSHVRMPSRGPACPITIPSIVVATTTTIINVRVIITAITVIIIIVLLLFVLGVGSSIEGAIAADGTVGYLVVRLVQMISSCLQFVIAESRRCIISTSSCCCCCCGWWVVIVAEQGNAGANAEMMVRRKVRSQPPCFVKKLKRVLAR